MNKLYPPSINGALPAFYSKTIDTKELSNLKNNKYNTDNSNGYFITCQNNATDPSTPSTFNEGKLQPLDPLNPNNKIFYYCGLYISDNTRPQQLAIIYQEDQEKHLELVLFNIDENNKDWDNIEKNKTYNIYFTIDNTIQINQVDEWMRSSSSNTPSSCGIYLEPIQKNEIAEILIPFSMNRSVGKEDIKGFALKIKTIQTNTQICVLEQEKKDIQFLNNQIKFIMPSIHINQIYPGEFLKAQLAYLYGEGDTIENWSIGYYSTVGIIKYTGKPAIEIQNLSTDNNNMFLLDKYIGEYVNSLDSTEKPILHCFSLSVNNVLKETSGWINQNSYSFDTDIIDEEVNYQIKYQVKTLNDLEEEIIYNCVTPSSADPQLKINLHANNNFDNGYVELSFKPDGWIFSSELQNLQKKTITVDSTNLQLNIENTNDDNQIFNEVGDDTLKTGLGSELQRQDIAVNDDLLTIMSQMIWPDSDKTLYLYRTTSGSNDWIKIATIQNLSSYDNAFEWFFKDFTVEQGKEYQYGFKEQVTKNATEDVTIIKKSEPIVADFEDAFLWDGQRQIRIRFNPKISSFKTNRLESKVETIGNRYPFIFRNETVEYKEFPISGLISYLADNAELFMSAAELGIILNQYNERTGTPTSVTNVSYNQSETTDLLSYNIKAERIFKLELLDWLGNGEIKLFKSPTEGNYLVRLMNVSLAPEDRLGRMLHSFSCTAYEVKENTDNNLLKLGFFNNKE